VRRPRSSLPWGLTPTVSYLPPRRGLIGVNPVRRTPTATWRSPPSAPATPPRNDLFASRRRNRGAMTLQSPRAAVGAVSSASCAHTTRPHYATTPPRRLYRRSEKVPRRTSTPLPHLALRTHRPRRFTALPTSEKDQRARNLATATTRGTKRAAPRATLAAYTTNLAPPQWPRT